MMSLDLLTLTKSMQSMGVSDFQEALRLQIRLLAQAKGMLTLHVAHRSRQRLQRRG